MLVFQTGGWMILKFYDDSVSRIWGIIHCLILVKKRTCQKLALPSSLGQI